MIANLVDALRVCSSGIQERMIRHLTEADADYGRRVEQGLEQGGHRKISSGQTDPQQAVGLSKQMGREADPY